MRKYLPPNILYLEHYQNHETNRSQYLRGLAVDYIQNEYNDRNAHYFARELMYKGFYKTAIDFFELHITEKGWRTEQGQSFTYIGDCHKYLGDTDLAIKNYAIAYTYDMGRREPLMAWGQILLDQKRWVEAERIFKLALMIPKGNYYSNLEANYTHLPYHQLALCQFFQGKMEESYANLKKAIEIDPNNNLYKKNLQFYPLTIPKIMHHIWVGPKNPPLEWMNTWKEKHPGWEYILWDNKKVFGRKWINQKHIDYYKEKGIWHGVADIVRYEILYEMGGFMPGADTICLHNIEELFRDGNEVYTVYENELIANDLVTPIYACKKGNKFALDLINGLLDKKSVDEPWISTGNVYVRDMIAKIKPAKLKIFPSYTFIPVHKSGMKYGGKEKIYAEQKWATTFNLY